MTITRSVLEDNTAQNGGGGINNLNGDVILDDTTLADNSAGYGGGIVNSSGTLTMTRSVVAGNTATNGGGGIRNQRIANVTSSTISGNTSLSGNGGGVYSRTFHTLTITDVTIYGNTAGGAGGGVFSEIFAGGGGSATVRNSIVAGNTAVDPDLSGEFDAEVSLIGDVGTAVVNDVGIGNNQIGGGGSPAIDPLLGPLQDNGGPTRTHVPAPSSPAIDQGRSFATFTDQRGAVRTADIPSISQPPFGDGTDIGAVEVVAMVETAGAKLTVEGTLLDDTGCSIAASARRTKDDKGGSR